MEQKNNVCIHVLCYEDDLVYPIHISDKTYKNCMDLLMIINGNKSHYICIKIFNRFMCNKTKCKTKKHLLDIFADNV